MAPSAGPEWSVFLEPVSGDRVTAGVPASSQAPAEGTHAAQRAPASRPSAGVLLTPPRSLVGTRGAEGTERDGRPGRAPSCGLCGRPSSRRRREAPLTVRHSDAEM